MISSVIDSCRFRIVESSVGTEINLENTAAVAAGLGVVVTSVHIGAASQL